MGKLNGQVAIVTGGARGIGEGVCKIFCDQGATVVIWDIIDEGQNTCNKIKQTGGNIIFQKVNVTNQSSVDKAVKEIISQYKRIDILINNAGIIRDRSFLKMSRDEWDRVIDVNINSSRNASTFGYCAHLT